MIMRATASSYTSSLGTRFTLNWTVAKLTEAITISTAPSLVSCCILTKVPLRYKDCFLSLFFEVQCAVKFVVGVLFKFILCWESL